MIRSVSLRTQRLTRRLARSRAGGGLNLVSLMDIFTILVFFLLVNSSQVEVLPSPRDLVLPDSVTTEKPAEQTLLMVTRDTILLNGQPVMALAEAAASTTPVLDLLRAQLLLLPLAPGADGSSALTRGEINIMADREIPYQLIKKLMATCTEARFARISLAVVSKPAGTGG
jgi:biopolymer transport protein TolR